MGGYVGDVTALHFLQLHTGSKEHEQLLVAGVPICLGMHACVGRLDPDHS